MSRHKRLFAGLALLLVLSAGLGWLDYRRVLGTPLSVPAGGVEFVVARGSSVGGLAQALAAQGLLRQPTWFVLYARTTGLAARIQAGEYFIAPGTTPKALLEQWAAGRVIERELVLIEGWTLRQIRAALRAAPKLGQTLDDVTDAELMARLGQPSQPAEGRFFPATYRYRLGDRDIDLLRRAYKAMAERLAAAWARRATDLPLASADDALTLASIVERETPLAAERPAVAGVYVRRLRLGMLLQADPTLIYGLGEDYTGTLTRADLQRDTPYNTYLHKGLPPTPIGAPGAEALAAAVAPAAGDALYFVARGDGGHVFSATYDEHRRAVQAYRRFQQQATEEP